MKITDMNMLAPPSGGAAVDSSTVGLEGDDTFDAMFTAMRRSGRSTATDRPAGRENSTSTDEPRRSEPSKGEDAAERSESAEESPDDADRVDNVPVEDAVVGSDSSGRSEAMLKSEKPESSVKTGSSGAGPSTQQDAQASRPAIMPNIPAQRESQQSSGVADEGKTAPPPRPGPDVAASPAARAELDETVIYSAKTDTPSKSSPTQPSSATPQVGTMPDSTGSSTAQQDGKTDQGRDENPSRGDQPRDTSAPAAQGRSGPTTPVFTTAMESTGPSPTAATVHADAAAVQSIGDASPSPAGPPAPTTSTTTTSTLPADPSSRLPDGDAQRITEQALRAVRGGVNQRGGSVTLQLSPPDLGTLKVRLDMDHNTVRAHFETASESVRTLLHQQMAGLRSALESHGLTVENLQVQMQNPADAQQGFAQQNTETDDDGRSRGSFRHDRSPGEGDEEEQDGEHAERRPNFQRELLNLIA